MIALASFDPVMLHARRCVLAVEPVFIGFKGRLSSLSTVLGASLPALCPIAVLGKGAGVAVETYTQGLDQDSGHVACSIPWTGDKRICLDVHVQLTEHFLHTSLRIPLMAQ